MAAVPFRVKALFEYVSEHEDDLNFDESQIITVTAEEDDDWYFGELTDSSGVKKSGIFPRNFVERIEPTAPPRPTRRSKQDSIDASAAPISVPVPVQPLAAAPQEAPSEPEPELQPEPVADLEEESAPLSPVSAPVPEPVPILPPAPTAPVSTPAPPVPQQPKAPESVVSSPPPVPAPAAKPTPPSQLKSGGPPPVAVKPAGNALRDRIAAFNKGGGGPIVPIKPGSAKPFIKKPFVAPPPSRDAYVPIVRNDYPTPKIYHRNEDPEIKQQEAENREIGKTISLTEPSKDGEEEDQPKPLSLKERMALLQKQQMEAAQRHADIIAKKDKPKKPPPKKRVESTEPAVAADPVPAEAEAEAAEAPGKKSLDESQVPLVPTSPSRRRAPKPAEAADGNEADMSGAGETTEGAEDLTEREDTEDQAGKKPVVSASSLQQKEPNEEREQTEEGVEEEEEEDEEDDDDIDPEIRRKEELRARMAKISGGMGMPGMGMAGMFGGPMMMGLGGAPAIRKKKPSVPKERKSVDEQRDEESSFAPAAAPPVPIPGMGMGMMALPGMSQRKRTEEGEPVAPASPPQAPTKPETEAEAEETVEEAVPLRPAPPAIPQSPPTARPRIPSEARSPPPPPPVAPPAAEVLSPSPGSASDDEQTDDPNAGPSTPAARSPPPLPPIGASPTSTAPRIPNIPAISSSADEAPSSPSSKRLSRPPPIPGSAPAIPTMPVVSSAPAVPPAQTRAPPPPPPSAAPNIPTAAVNDEEQEEVTEYDGDYDTDIASSAPHKDALRRESVSTGAEDMASSVSTPVLSAVAPRAVPPPVPSSPAPSNDTRRSIDAPRGMPDTRRSIDAPRGAPPRPPSETRRSMDTPRAAPPPPPAAAAASGEQSMENVYRTQRQSFSYSRQPPTEPMIQEEGAYSVPTAISSPPRMPAHASSASRSTRQSFDGVRMSGRRSIDAGRQSLSMEHGFIANDVDLAQQTGWFTQDNQVPPVFQNRNDLVFESENDTSTNQGAKTVITRTIYVLFKDYSQTIITVRYDPYNPADVEMEQRHEPPPRQPRQDQMEEAYSRYGRAIAEAVAGKKDTTVGDGTPHALIHELLRPHSDALGPVGTGSFGAAVYVNIDNMTTQQHDQIRPGDILVVREARFQGKHGPMHAKYSMEVGKPEHVAVVAEWDGMKKKVRAWEQGRESKKVKMESYKLEDLRGGQVRIWRVMPRTWVGWSAAK
ncbi:hypothetical protein TD95_001133 [Thielaviopsis punctulata]|uniref:SH3 domain-containing protein n=1 Tax=Thielaviopsis punctulata TaxID=72032 RepID=A0A0F4ZB57_9PEZI|nr:hypothetical protein TD95_001133 [Thielaviopsis punctulata]